MTGPLNGTFSGELSIRNLDLFIESTEATGKAVEYYNVYHRLIAPEFEGDCGGHAALEVLGCARDRPEVVLRLAHVDDAK